MKKQLSYYAQKLEEAGIDTSKFNLELNGVVLNLEDLTSRKTTSGETAKDMIDGLTKIVLEYTVPKTYVSTSSDLFRKFGCLCLNYRQAVSLNKKHEQEKGFDAFVRNELPYAYQFEFILSNVLNKKDDFADVARNFFTNDVLISLCEHLVKKLEKSKEFHGYGDVYYLLNNLKSATNNGEFKKTFGKFNTLTEFIWGHQYKCPAWKDAYKGLMNFCAIDYLIKQGKIKSMSLNELHELLLNEEYMNKPYMFQKLLETLTEGMGI